MKGKKVKTEFCKYLFWLSLLVIFHPSWHNSTQVVMGRKGWYFQLNRWGWKPTFYKRLKVFADGNIMHYIGYRRHLKVKTIPSPRCIDYSSPIGYLFPVHLPTLTVSTKELIYINLFNTGLLVCKYTSKCLSLLFNSHWKFADCILQTAVSMRNCWNFPRDNFSPISITKSPTDIFSPS